jgi:hypothetical protein
LDQSWPIWVDLTALEDDGVNVIFWVTPLPRDPSPDEPRVYDGRRNKDRISAVDRGPLVGLGCSTDGAIANQIGGELTATLTDNHLVGVYTDVFGSGPQMVVMQFEFDAEL